MLTVINTKKCNYECKHCCIEASPHFKEMLSDQDYMDAIKTFATENVHIVGGEPFLHPRIIWQIEFATWAVDRVSIVTNGSWILTRQGTPSKKFLAFEEAMLGVDTSKIVISLSNDYWHQEFHSYMNIEAAESLLRSTGVEVTDNYKDPHNMRGVLPIGRAVTEEVYQKNAHSDRWDTAQCSEGFQPTVVPNGDIAICCNGRQTIGHVRYGYDQAYWEEQYKIIKQPEGTSCLHACPGCKINSVLNSKYDEAHLKIIA